MGRRLLAGDKLSRCLEAADTCRLQAASYQEMQVAKLTLITLKGFTF